ncbi:thiolase C-terminal domain-containing protein [Microbacterium sp. RD1]|uniref:thiolase C-terminal domain-containing protein n=1 Tax=Microbacterium sp. RD1 TaxID=3457313 RepID=UPI003FA5A01E
MTDRRPVIVGAAASDAPRTPHLNVIGHHGQAFARALADSGVAKSEIDGFFMADADIPGMTPYAVTDVAEYLGIRYRYADSTYTGGSSFEHLVQHAALAIEHGLCETAAITYGSDLYSSVGRSLGTGGGDLRPYGARQFESPYGNSVVGSYALFARRHMHEYGTTEEQLAEVAVSTREYAQHNPDAMYREPITVDDVMSSRYIADPLKKLDSCVVSDGGGALILTTAERARDLPHRPVHILGSGVGQTHWAVHQSPTFDTTAAPAAAAAAYAQAGLGPGDVDALMAYDSFTITVLLLIEGLGFCEKGEGGRFIADGNLRLDGRLPTNTDGGGLSACHPGMRGMHLLLEAVRQLRGEAGPVQVADCDVVMAAGSGGWASAIGAVLLGTEAAAS